MFERTRNNLNPFTIYSICLNFDILNFIFSWVLAVCFIRAPSIYHHPCPDPSSSASFSNFLILFYLSSCTVSYFSASILTCLPIFMPMSCLGCMVTLRCSALHLGAFSVFSPPENSSLHSPLSCMSSLHHLGNAPLLNFKYDLPPYFLSNQNLKFDLQQVPKSNHASSFCWKFDPTRSRQRAERVEGMWLKSWLPMIRPTKIFG